LDDNYNKVYIVYFYFTLNYILKIKKNLQSITMFNSGYISYSYFTFNYILKLKNYNIYNNILKDSPFW